MLLLKIRKYFCIGILLGSLQLGWGQSKNVMVEYDSLTKLLPTLKQDTLRVDALVGIARTWISRDPTKAIQFLNEALELAQKVNNKSRLTDCMITLGYQYSNNGETTKAIQLLQEVVKMTEKDDKHMTAIANTFISIAYKNQDDLENALKYAQPAYYYFENRQQQGEPYTDAFTGAPMGIGEIYLLMGRLDSALFYLEKSYATKHLIKTRDFSNRFFNFHVPFVLGQIHLERKEYALALKHIQECLYEAKRLDDSVGICEGQLALANYYNLNNHSDSLVAPAVSALKIAQKLKMYKVALDAGLLLKTWYQGQNEPTKALFYASIADVAKDSMSNVEKVKQGQRLVFQEEQYQQNLVAEKTAYRNRLMFYGLVAGLCILALLAWVLYLNYKRKQKETLLLSNEIKLQKTAFQSKLVETEMTALRAQMNPHFIFNCLNSIKLHTLENNPIVASDYLTKFSKLIRLVLENSRSEKVTLVNELDMLQLYMEMEAMRFKDKMQFKINIEEDLDTHFIEIPPLLLQPYIENAIWHGLMHKEEGGSVILDIETKDEQMLRITITDNGIGRKAAAALKSKTATNNKSFGLKMTSERIGLINQLYKSDTQVQIEDLTDAAGNALGTKVIIEIPI